MCVYIYIIPFDDNTVLVFQSGLPLLLLLLLLFLLFLLLLLLLSFFLVAAASIVLLWCRYRDVQCKVNRIHRPDLAHNFSCPNLAAWPCCRVPVGY